jgi:hypothetical protein
LLVATLALSSLLHFNRDGDWDNPGASTSSVPTRWDSQLLGDEPQRTFSWLVPDARLGHQRAAARLPATYCRGAVVALMLAFAGRCGLLERWPKSRLIAYLGQISYSVFLVHFRSA